MRVCDVASDIVPRPKFGVKSEWDSWSCVVLVLTECFSDEAPIGGPVVTLGSWYCLLELKS